jgi:hypothetical protein
VPEAKCLRSKTEQIVNQKKAAEFNQTLSKEWIDKKEPLFFYVNGHIRVYHGNLANLPKRYVSREKLCLAGTTEFRVNNELGMPYMVVTSELNEKLKDIILNQIKKLREKAARTEAKLFNEIENNPDCDMAALKQHIENNQPCMKLLPLMKPKLNHFKRTGRKHLIILK